MKIIYRVRRLWGDEYLFTDGKKALELAEKMKEGCNNTITIELEEANPEIKEGEE